MDAAQFQAVMPLAAEESAKQIALLQQSHAAQLQQVIAQMQAAAAPRGPRPAAPSSFDGRSNALDAWKAEMLRQFAWYNSNTDADPEGLDIVLRSGVPVRMVGLNLTHQALATPEVVERMSAMPHDLGRTCAAWMGFFGGSYKRIWDFDAPPVHDPCTIAALIDPEVITWQESFVAVELEGRWTRGTTVVDLHGRYPDQPPNAAVAIGLDVDRYWQLVLDAVDALGSRASGS